MSVGKEENERAAEVAEVVSAAANEGYNECTACSTKYAPDQLIELRCADHYCTECLENFFRTAMKDETMYPPRCCGQTISISLIQTKVSNAFVRRFKAKKLELTTKNKTYCWRPRCSAFIAPHSIHNDQAICQKCRAVTCAKCRNGWHFGPCPTGIDVEFFDLVRSSRWKKCPTCQRIVEKDDGCNHMICRCGSEFCYGCGGDIDACDCTSDADDENIGFYDI